MDRTVLWTSRIVIAPDADKMSEEFGLADLAILLSFETRRSIYRTPVRQISVPGTFEAAAVGVVWGSEEEIRAGVEALPFRCIVAIGIGAEPANLPEHVCYVNADKLDHPMRVEVDLMEERIYELRVYDGVPPAPAEDDDEVTLGSLEPDESE